MIIGENKSKNLMLIMHLAIIIGGYVLMPHQMQRTINNGNFDPILSPKSYFYSVVSIVPIAVWFTEKIKSARLLMVSSAGIALFLTRDFVLFPFQIGVVTLALLANAIMYLMIFLRVEDGWLRKSLRTLPNYKQNSSWGNFQFVVVAFDVFVVISSDKIVILSFVDLLVIFVIIGLKAVVINSHVKEVNQKILTGKICNDK